MIDGDVENGSLMAGQSVGMVTREQTDRGDPGRAGRPGGRRAGAAEGFADNPAMGAGYRAEIVSGAAE